MTGPFESEREARAAAHAVIQPEDGWSILSGTQNRLLLARACETAGVELGAYDRRILIWLAGYEDAICEVIADLILRARATGKAAAIPPRSVVFGLMAGDDYFVLTEALREWSALQRHQAANDPASADSRHQWADAADAMVARIEAALSGGTR